MGAWVATVLRDLFHDTGSPFSPPALSQPALSQPALGTADATRTGNAIAGGSHVLAGR